MASRTRCRGRPCEPSAERLLWVKLGKVSQLPPLSARAAGQAAVAPAGVGHGSISTGTEADLRAMLARLDGSGYRGYKEIRGSYTMGSCRLHIDHVQADPYASPSRVRLVVPQSTGRFPPECLATRAGGNGLCAYLAVELDRRARARSRPPGSGPSGIIQIDAPGQELIERTALLVDTEQAEARLAVGLPAAGRRISGTEAARLLCDELPAMAAEVLDYGCHDPAAVLAYVQARETASAARLELERRDLVAFVADGSVLPRVSGVDHRPLPSPDAVSFVSPATLRVQLDLPHVGMVSGMGIPRGITLIVGGGFHGKSTLLRALELGVYDHRPGDGRELVVTDPSAVKIRAEDGRRVCGVDISPFIGPLPNGGDTAAFCTDNASGSTSQAAATMEALETGCRLLLLDEDTTATNFMIRDQRMQHLIHDDHEPITPFVDRVRQLYTDCGVSTVLVTGGSGDYLDVADTVVEMRHYQPQDVTAQARAVAASLPTRRRQASATFPAWGKGRRPQPHSVDPRRGQRPVSVKARGARKVILGEQEIDLAALEQLVEPAQARAVGAALAYAGERYMDGTRTVAQIVELVEQDLESGGLDVLDPRLVGDHARFRPQELAAALNRLRALQVVLAPAPGPTPAGEKPS
jgi:predicted ABC-class ATPase